MLGQDSLDAAFVIFAILMQVVLVVFFALRKWKFATAMKFGWIVYALSVPAAILSVMLCLAGKPWYLWLGGFLYAGWGIFGYIVDIARPVEWRSPIRWPVLIPYVTLYIASLTFYWWPLGLIARPLWYGYAVLFVASTVLNLSSHARPHSMAAD